MRPELLADALARARSEGGEPRGRWYVNVLIGLSKAAGVGRQKALPGLLSATEAAAEARQYILGLSTPLGITLPGECTAAAPRPTVRWPNSPFAVLNQCFPAFAADLAIVAFSAARVNLDDNATPTPTFLPGDRDQAVCGSAKRLRFARASWPVQACEQSGGFANSRSRSRRASLAHCTPC